MKRRARASRTRRRAKRSRYASRKRPYGRKRIYRRRGGRVAAVHRFIRGLTGLSAGTVASNWAGGSTFNTSGRIQGSAAYVNGTWLGAFQLNGITNLINSSEFLNLFDQYRVDKLILKFYLKVDPSAQAAAAATIPRLYMVRDRDDSNAPADLNELKENQFCKERVMSLYRPITVVCRPNALQLVYQSALANQFKPTWSTWMDVGTPNTPHYAYKFGIDRFDNTNFYVDVEATVVFSCRQSR